MRIFVAEKCQEELAMHCRGEAQTKQQLRAECRAKYAVAKKKK